MMPKEDESKQKSQKLDHITEIIGIFGPFHGFWYTVLAVSIIAHAWQMMSNKFLTYETEFWCARPNHLMHLTPEEWMNMSAPIVQGDFDRCHIFDVPVYKNNSIRPPNTTNHKACIQWEYFNEHFQNTITKRWNLVCGPLSNFPRIVQIVFFVGNMIGVLLIGPYSDWYGRKTAYMTAVTIWSTVTIIGYFMDNPYGWLVTRFLAGASSLAYNTVSDVYRVEFTSGVWRAKSTHWFGEIPWHLGHLSLGLIVYLIPNMKHLELFIGCFNLMFLPLWYFMPESPRWLLSNGRKEEAIKVLKLVCKWNKKPTTALDQMENLELISTEDNQKTKQKKGTFHDLIKNPATRRNALCMTFCWFAFSMGYFGLVYNTPTFDWNIYLVFVLPTFLLIPCVYLEPFFENKFGRKPIFTFSLITAGLMLLLTMVVPKGVAVIILAWIGTISCSIAFGAGYTYTKELFPTILRTTALGTASAGARVGSLSSPAIAMLDSVSPVLPLVIYGAIVLMAGIVSLWLWPETKTKHLPETLEDAEKVAATNNPWVKCC